VHEVNNEIQKQNQQKYHGVKKTFEMHGITFFFILKQDKNSWRLKYLKLLKHSHKNELK